MLESPRAMPGNVRNGTMASYGDDSQVHVEFTLEAVLDQFKMDESGIPTYHDVEMITIWTPGKRDTHKDKVNEFYKKRFKVQYDDFKAGREPSHDGLPLTEWPVLTKAAALNLRNSKIFTVEQLADVVDTNLDSLGLGGRELRDKAKAYLERGVGSKEITKVFAELEKLKADNAALHEMLELKTDPKKTLKLKEA